MKKMRQILVMLMVLFSLSIFAQNQLTFRFANAQLIDMGTKLQFDVEAKSDIAGVYIGLTNVSFVYNTDIFGTNIYPLSLTVGKGILLNEIDPVFNGPKYNLIGLANTFPNTFGVGTEVIWGGSATPGVLHTLWPTDFVQMYVFTIEFSCPVAPVVDILAGIEFQQGLMNGEQFNFIGGNNYTPALNPNFYDNDLLNFVVCAGGSGCIPGLWTGTAGDGEWFNPLNWDCGVVPENIDVEIPGVTKASVVIGGGIATTAALTIGAGSDVTVDYDGGLTTNGLFTNNGTFTIDSEGFNGESGSYIDLGGIVGAGIFHFNRDVVCSGTAPGVADPFGWHYLSSPFNGFTTDDIPDYFANAWNQAAGQWIQVYNMIPCTPVPTTPLATMDAWSVNWDATYPDPNCPPGSLPTGTGMVIEFSGFAADVHTGMYSKPLGYGATGFQMWNLVANPYPSGLDFNTITWGANTVQGAATYWGCVGNYYYWTPALGSYSMPPTNGFFVETIGADNFTIDNSNRAHNPDWFWKSEVSNLLTLQASGNELSDLLHVRFMDGVTAGFDLNGDFNKLFSTTEGLAQIYTVAGENKLAVNALPATEVVPMGFVANSTGTYTIEAVETSEFNEVILEDKLANTFTNLLTSTYTFDYTLGADANRFNIHFAPLSVSDINANDISIWSNEDKIYVSVPGAINGDIVVYNMMGQEIVRTNVAPGLNVIPMNSNNAYYVVKVVSSETAVTGKVYIK